MADTTAKKLELAQAQVVELRAKLHEERMKRRQVEANAIEAKRTLSAKIARLERTRRGAENGVRESKALAASAEAGDVFRQRVTSLEFGVGAVEVGPVPEGVQVVVRVPPGTTSGSVGPVLRELAIAVVVGDAPLDPRRGAWELVRARSSDEGAVDGELAAAIEDLRAQLGIDAELPAFVRAMREAYAERASAPEEAAEQPPEEEGEGAPAEASSVAQEGAPSADGSEPPASVDETGDAPPPVEGSRRRRAAAVG